MHGYASHSLKTLDRQVSHDQKLLLILEEPINLFRQCSSCLDNTVRFSYVALKIYFPIVCIYWSLFQTLG